MEFDMPISTPLDGNNDVVQRTKATNGRTTGPARRSTKGQWTAEEDDILRKAVQRFKGKNWKKIAECFKDRTDVQCLHRWQKVLNPELIKGPWSKEEDEMIIELVNKFGPKKWSTIAQHLPGRIGKQCRERWHNHLNPAINKDAWTQEEELALIRAHQIYGNRWAELTKFLPGRTDNSIKNHWNSSVRKKLDAYLASGLLEQLPPLPLVGHQGQPIHSSSSRGQASADDGGQKYGREADEVSGCSQESSVVGCSQSVRDLGNLELNAGEGFHLNEESCFRMEQCSRSPSCSEKFYAPLGDVHPSITEIPSEMACSSGFLPSNFLIGCVTSGSMDYHPNLQELPKISLLHMGKEVPEMPAHPMHAAGDYELMNIPFQTLLSDCVAKPDLISDDECCRFLFPEGANYGTLSPGNPEKSSFILALDEASDPLHHQSVYVNLSEVDRPSVLESYCPPTSALLETSCNQSTSSSTPLLKAADCTLPNQSLHHSFGSERQEPTSTIHDDFINGNETANNAGDGICDTELQEQPYPEEPRKLVPLNSFNFISSTAELHPASEREDLNTKEQGVGALCYEPPRFPSSDIPFFSCDLVHAGSDMQQEYSPLGIRQLMMSSMGCISPFRLWGSPSHVDSPAAVLRNAAKTFTSTPSILKKRSRDLLSPSSDRRDDKKLEVGRAASLAKEFSRLDVMFDEAEAPKASAQSLSSDKRTSNESSHSEDKENVDPALNRQDKSRDVAAKLPDSKLSDKSIGNSNFKEKRIQGTLDSNSSRSDLCIQKTQQPPGVLSDDWHEILLFSPDQVGFKADRMFGSSSRTPRNLYYRKILGTLSEQAISESSSRKQCLVVCSPASSKKKNDGIPVLAASAQSLPSSAPLDGTENAAGTENISIFGETSFPRSFESPSAWKSPWFINSFLPGPKVDTDISIEDITYFSPGNGSYDAIALMRQLGEHSATAYADALEVLGKETPLSKKKGPSDQNVKKENNQKKQLGKQSPLASDRMSECRTLDFSECGPPGKETESLNIPSALVSSSPSSHLLKGCR